MQTKRETATLAARLLTFVMSLGILGCLWLPWVRIDGMRESSTGTELMVLMAAPSLDYLWVASPISAGVLIGGPVAILLFGLLAASRYAQRRTAIFSTVVVLVVAVGLPQVAKGLLLDGEPRYEAGLVLIIAVAGLLLAQQLLIKAATILRTKGKFPALYRTLTVATGAGPHRWSER